MFVLFDVIKTEQRVISALCSQFIVPTESDFRSPLMVALKVQYVGILEQNIKKCTQDINKVQRYNDVKFFADEIYQHQTSC